MDREKRRSEEDEKELDRKIALIREKNQKIEQRSKEIEEDRARNADPNGKSPKAAQLQLESKSKSGQWSREWDKGKTPVDKWRENVPSIDLKDRLANSKTSANRSANNNNNHKNHRQSESKMQKNQPTGPKIPSRLEGRITFPNQQQKNHQNVEKSGRNAKKTNQEPQQKPNEDVQKGQRRRSKNKETAKPHKENEKTEESAKKNKNRPRRESDNYAVKKVVRGMIENVCWMERLEKRKNKKEQEEKKDCGKENEEKIEETKVSSEIKEEIVPEAVEQKKEESKENKSESEDANQNVISLVREKVATLTMSEVN